MEPGTRARSGSASRLRAAPCGSGPCGSGPCGSGPGAASVRNTVSTAFGWQWQGEPVPAAL